MSKVGRPSRSPKKLKDGYYMSVVLKNTSKPVRIMRESFEQLNQAKEQYKDRGFKYIGQVQNNFWIDGENKGKPTVKVIK